MKTVQTAWAIVMLKTEYPNAPKQVLELSLSKKEADDRRKKHWPQSSAIRLQRYLLVETK